MRCVVALPCSLIWPRLTIVAAITLGTAACSSNSARFSEGYPPSGTRPSSEVTGSVTSQPAPAISSTTLPPPSAPPQAEQPQQMAQSAPPPASRIVSNAPAKSTTAPAAQPATAKPMHTVIGGDTLHKIARQYQVSVTNLTAANNLERHAKLKVGDQLVVPGARPMQPAAQKPLVLAKPVASNTPAAPNAQDAKPPASSVNKMTQAPDVIAENMGVVAPTLSFRRPVNGRVISGFGPKPSGTENPGINFAVPEGTPIKAAEDGVVAYASSELKPYGNLVMIRHANGYVTTYAHASEILVKRDDIVKRGQVIAKSGQTGSVSSPQLHFEIRKGPTPVDPMPFLERGPG